MGINFHPHLHALVSKGAFDAHGIFYPLPWIDTQKMALVFREKVFTMLIQEEKICEDLAGRIYDWPQSGFNIHSEVEIKADDDKGKGNLAQYIIKTPISQERMTGKPKGDNYKSKHGTIAYEPLDWLASITSHIPNKCSGECLFFGCYVARRIMLRVKTMRPTKSNL